MERSHSSIDFGASPKSPKSMLGKAKTKLFHFGDHKVKSFDTETTNKKTMKQTALDYIFKNDRKDDSKVIKKQFSISGYPTEIRIEDYNDLVLGNSSPTASEEKIDSNRDTAALALERPRKKLSFKEPVTSEYGQLPNMTFKEPECKNNNSLVVPTGIKRSVSLNNTVERIPSIDDFELENQAMRVVRTVGQAFEVCHKLQISAPENGNRDHDEQDTLAQEITSDRLSDCTVEKTNRKDIPLESDLDKLSLSPDEGAYMDPNDNKNFRGAFHRSPSFNNQYSMGMPRNFSFSQSDASPTESQQQPFVTSGNAGQDVQVLREQVDKQSQQLQTLMTQLQLLNDQLASEQSLRMEAQSRVQQLLVHNRELLDHIAALVMHLQENDQGPQQNSPHATLPQQGLAEKLSEIEQAMNMNYVMGLDSANLITENRAVTSCLPPLCNYGSGNLYNYPYHPDNTHEAIQLLQRLQTLLGYSQCGYNPYPYYQPFMGSMTLPQKRFPSTSRHSFDGTQIPPMRQSPLRSLNVNRAQSMGPKSNPNGSAEQVFQRNATLPRSSRSKDECDFIKPLPKMGALTTVTTVDGKVKVVMPVPSQNSKREADSKGLLANLKLTDDFLMNGPPPQRTTSEKVPNRSELMSQVQRSMWARHTTK